ncbi:hypothetical protein [Sinorhizobium meliloti]|uniref:hypothetical protein n=1 Tax=Rhizobium meliloti TaxID=382 RepID=UPI0018E2384A|nr:hypothetical protein [Sinorhizobium meliloti]
MERQLLALRSLAPAGAYGVLAGLEAADLDLAVAPGLLDSIPGATDVASCRSRE